MLRARGRLVPLTAGLAAMSANSFYGSCLGLPLGARSPGELPQNVFRYILEASGLHQLLLLVLTVAIFLLEVVPLELQRQAINDLVKHRDYHLVIILCAVYAGIILVQGEPSLRSTSIAVGSASAPNAISAGESGPSSRRRPTCRPQPKLRGSRSR